MPGSAVLDDDCLIDCLVECIDEIREIYSELCVNQWRVFTVKRTWTGTRRGEGSFVEVVNELLPTPRVADERSRELDGAGMNESKQIVLKEVSLSYTETELLGYPQGDIPANVDWLYKIVDANGQGLADRYFEVGKEPPKPDRDKTIGWTIVLQRADGVD